MTTGGSQWPQSRGRGPITCHSLVKTSVKERRVRLRTTEMHPECNTWFGVETFDHQCEPERHAESWVTIRVKEQRPCEEWSSPDSRVVEWK